VSVKRFLALVLVVLVILSGYFLLFQEPKEDKKEATAPEIEGKTLEAVIEENNDFLERVTRSDVSFNESDIATSGSNEGERYGVVELSGSWRHDSRDYRFLSRATNRSGEFFLEEQRLKIYFLQGSPPSYSSLERGIEESLSSGLEPDCRKVEEVDRSLHPETQVAECDLKLSGQKDAQIRAFKYSHSDVFITICRTLSGLENYDAEC